MNDRIRSWDARYAAGEGLHAYAPAPVVAEAAGLAAPGLALDLACGAGRNAVHLAERGWRVVAVDGSSVAIDLLAAEARRRGVLGRIDARVADLEAGELAIEPACFDLVLDIHYLDRGLFPAIRDGVRPGGLLAAAIHIEDPSAERAMSPGFLLAPGELPALIASWGWEVLASFEGAPRESGHRRASSEIIARRPGPAQSTGRER